MATELKAPPAPGGRWDRRRLGVIAAPVERIGAAADVVVVGRDRGLLQRHLPGSVSGELIVEGPCDVFVVR